MKDRERILRIEAPHFVAGAIFVLHGGKWSVGRTAPILAWMKRMPVEKIEPYLKRKGWKHSWL